MDELARMLRVESESLDQRIDASRQRWDSFLNTFSSFVSSIRIEGKPILPPMMTPERRREMQMYRKQACITEVRLKSRSRERDFMKRIQNAMDELQNERRDEDDSGGASEGLETTRFTPCLQETEKQTTTKTAPVAIISPPPPKEMTSTPPLLSQSPKPQRPQTSGSPHQISSPASPKSVPSIASSAHIAGPCADLATSDSDSGDVRKLIIVKGARIHRRRRTDSGGSTDSQASSTEPALRRTGSGDIAIGNSSQATKKVSRHKRGGSGDLVTIKISQEPINKKLSRSQDLALRRTRSSELTVDTSSPVHRPVHRVPSDSSNPESIPGESASEPIDLRLLSPQQTQSAASTPGKERLIVFNRGESLRRPLQNVNQESSGPPQPMKGNHSISRVPVPEAPLQSVATQDGPSYESLVPSGPFFPEKQETVDNSQPDKEITPEKTSDSGIASHPSKEADGIDSNTPFASDDPMAVTVVRKSLTTENSRKSSPLLSAVALVDESTNTTTAPVVFKKPPTADSLDCFDSDAVTGQAGYKELPEKLSSQHDSLTQHWLLQKISELSSNNDVSLAGWLQNAPDSVKQKLSEAKAKVPEVQIRVSQSIDDTLRSTSPIPDEEHLEEIVDEESTVIKSPIQLLVRSNSYTLDKPSAALLTVQKIKKSTSHGTSPPKSLSEFIPEKSASLPTVTNRTDKKKSPSNETTSPLTANSPPTTKPHVTTPPKPAPAPQVLSPPSAKERNRAAASKSYVVEKPSPALLDSLHESEKSAHEIVNPDPRRTPPQKSHRGQSTGSESQRTSAEQNRPDSMSSSGQKRVVQRKLDYESTSTQRSNNPSRETPESRNGKTEHLHRYLQMLGQAEMPSQTEVKDAWADHKAIKSSSKIVAKQPATHTQSSVAVKVTQPVVDRKEKENSPTKGVNLSLREALLVAEQKKIAQKSIKNDDDSLMQVRKELTLLKSKYAKKLSPRDINERPTSAEPQANKQIIEDLDRPSTALAHMSPYTHKHYKYQHTSGGKQVTLPGGQHHSTPNDRRISKGKENPQASYRIGNLPGHGSGDAGHVKSYAEKEATPIGSAYSVASDIDSSTIDEYSAYGGIVSLAHRPSTAISPGNRPDLHNQSDYSTSHRPHTSPGQANTENKTGYKLKESSSAKLGAVIKGHLCRKLLASSKVQSVVRTVKDCQNLLPERSIRNTSLRVSTPSLQDTHFQERLMAQMDAALLDIHDIFFDLPMAKRISLIAQSELMDAQNKAKSAKHAPAAKKPVKREKSIKRDSSHTSSKPQSRPMTASQAHRLPIYMQITDSPTTKRITAATQKVLDRKKVQRAASDPTRSLSVKMKRSVLAPTYAAASPKKASTVTDRVSQFQQAAK